MGTRHTGIPMLQYEGAYPPCTPSVSIQADINPFCDGDPVTFTPVISCFTAGSYLWLKNAAIVSTSAAPYVDSSLVNGDSIIFVIVDGFGRGYPSNKIVMVAKTEGCVEPALELTFDSIVNVPVASASSLSDWNTFFDLPTYGIPFTSVEVVGNMVRLIGGSGIEIKEQLFMSNNFLVGIHDKIGCVINLGATSFSGIEHLDFIILDSVVYIQYQAFSSSSIVTTFSMLSVITAEYYAFKSSDFPGGIYNFPNLEYIGDNGFDEIPRTDLTFYIPKCTSIGSTTGNNSVFFALNNQNVVITIPASVMTCNAGNPDGDIQYLQAHNTVTIITV